MEKIGIIFASSRIIYMILVPIIRELAGVLLAVAISKDCKARDNGSGVLWGLFTLLTPALAGIIYCVYSRFLTKRKGKTEKDRKQIKKSRKLTVWAILVYIIAIILAVVCLITTAASGIASIVADDGTNINSFMYDEYYDMNGVKYEEAEKVVLYDKQGNQYHIEEDPDGWNYYPYYDENGNKYDLEKCFISSDGYFYYDKDDSLVADEHDLFDYYCEFVYRDNQGNEYRTVGDYAFFDKDGKIVVHTTIKGGLNIYPFE